MINFCKILIIKIFSGEEFLLVNMTLCTNACTERKLFNIVVQEIGDNPEPGDAILTGDINGTQPLL
jgi:hypothetical protein